MKKIIYLNNPLKLIKKTLWVFLLSASGTAFSASGLIDIYYLAQKHDAALSQAKYQYEAQQQATIIARSPLLPQVMAEGTYGINDSSINRGDVTSRNIVISVRQSLYKPESWARYDQAQYQLQRSSYVMKIAEQNLILRATEAYFSLLLAQEEVALMQAQEKANQTQWQRAKASAEVGLASKTETLQARSSYDLSRADSIAAQNNLDVAYDELRRLTGQSLMDIKKVALDVVLPMSQPLASQPTMPQQESKAKANNLTVLKLAKAAKVSSQEIVVQQSGHWFEVGLQAKYSDIAYSNYNPTATGLFNDKSDFYVGAYISIPIYSGGMVSARVAEARANFSAANEGLRNAREQASLDARVQVRNIARGIALVKALREAVKSSDAFLEAAEEGHKVGLESLLEVLSARANKFKARRDLTAALHKVILASLKLEVATGDLTVEDLRRYDAILSE